MSFICIVWVVSAAGKLKDNEVKRAIQLRDIVTSLGPAYIKLGQVRARQQRGQLVLSHVFSVRWDGQCKLDRKRQYVSHCNALCCVACCERNLKLAMRLHCAQALAKICANHRQS